MKKIRKIILSFSSDKSYAQRQFKWRLHRTLNLDAPELFSEKMQYLKIYGQNELYFKYADKFMVREIVKQEIGEHYLNELYYVTDDPESINLNNLPDSFVLKATHGSGYNIICKSKKDINWITAKKKLHQWLQQDYAKEKREWQYKNIHPRIICEKYLSDDSGSLRDYKIMCFHGVPKLIWVDVDRFNGHKRAFFDTNWNRIHVEYNKYPDYPGIISKPENLNEMLECAAKLSKSFIFSRIDFYYVDGKTIFGEITFHPASGFAEFKPIDFSMTVASWMDISKVGRK